MTGALVEFDPALTVLVEDAEVDGIGGLAVQGEVGSAVTKGDAERVWQGADGVLLGMDAVEQESGADAQP